MTDHHKEILCGEDSSLRVEHLVGTSWTGDKAGFALTARTGHICASTHIKKLEPVPALLGQDMPRAEAFK
jgi:hypothetical protein